MDFQPRIKCHPTRKNRSGRNLVVKLNQVSHFLYIVSVLLNLFLPGKSIAPDAGITPADRTMTEAPVTAS
jgi:hypothetical protein